MKMRNAMGLITFIGVIALLSTTDTSAQRRGANQGSGGWGPQAAYNRNYDPKTVENLSGEVTSVDRLTPEKGMSYGIHLMLKTEKETISVHLGPGWYIERQDTQIKVKDTVQVKGSRITFEGKPAIIAADVKKGDEVLQLRDETGVPKWSGWRRRQAR
jgi:hypothetical protein